MIAKFITLALIVAAASADSPNSSLEGVDPNTLSCDPEGQIFLLLPHFTDCNKFFMCAHGREVEFTCGGPSLIFDFELQTCAWPYETTCKLRTQEDIDEGSGFDENDGVMGYGMFGEEPEQGAAVIRRSADDVGTVRPVSALTSSRFSSVINCQRADSAARLIPYKGDCQRYWRCMNGLPQAVYCSDGLYFSELKQQCDFEANVKCVVPNEVDTELNGEFIVYE